MNLLLILTLVVVRLRQGKPSPLPFSVKKWWKDVSDGLHVEQTRVADWGFAGKWAGRSERGFVGGNSDSQSGSGGGIVEQRHVCAESLGALSVSDGWGTCGAHADAVDAAGVWEWVLWRGGVAGGGRWADGASSAGVLCEFLRRTAPAGDSAQSDLLCAKWTVLWEPSYGHRVNDKKMTFFLLKIWNFSTRSVQLNHHHACFCHFLYSFYPFFQNPRESFLDMKQNEEKNDQNEKMRKKSFRERIFCA